jgi:hypothetical protein
LKENVCRNVWGKIRRNVEKKWGKNVGGEKGWREKFRAV